MTADDDSEGTGTESPATKETPAGAPEKTPEGEGPVGAPREGGSKKTNPWRDKPKKSVKDKAKKFAKNQQKKLWSSGGELPDVTLNKMTIRPDCGPDKSSGIEVMFNPASVTRQRAAEWTAPGRPPAEGAGGAGDKAGSEAELSFIATTPDVLSLQLVVDTYELQSRSSDDIDARAYTDRIVGLIDVDREKHRPPICTLKWGAQNLFVGVLHAVSVTFSMFLPSGTPVRASLSCEFTQHRTSAEEKAGELHSADVDRTYVVRDGDSLPSIAAECYGDSRSWRPIAHANDLDDPRRLATGAVLAVPRLRS